MRMVHRRRYQTKMHLEGPTEQWFITTVDIGGES